MTYEQLREKVDKIVSQAEDNVTNAINDYNEDNDEQIEIDTTDLFNNFDTLKGQLEIMLENS